MTRYRTKVVEKDAVRWTGDNWQEVADFLGRTNPAHDVSDMVIDRVVRIHTLEGVMQANAGDWIIRGVQGEFYPCKPDIFAATYDEV